MHVNGFGSLFLARETSYVAFYLLPVFSMIIYLSNIYQIRSDQQKWTCFFITVHIYLCLQSRIKSMRRYLNFTSCYSTHKEHQHNMNYSANYCNQHYL